MILPLTMAAAMVATPAPTHSWQFVGASEGAIFVDDNDQVQDGDKRKVWTIMVEDPSTPIGTQYPTAYGMSAHRIDCAKRTDAITKLFIYNGDGSILGERDNPYPEADVAPYSAGELIYNYVCKGQISTDKMVKLHTVKDVVSVGRNWLTIYDKLHAMAASRDAPK